MTATLEGYSQFTDNDLAVLHVDMTDTPSVPLGNLMAWRCRTN